MKTKLTDPAFLASIEAQACLRYNEQHYNPQWVIDDVVKCIPAALLRTYQRAVLKWWLSGDVNLQINEDTQFISKILQIHYNNRMHLKPDPMSYSDYSELLNDIDSREQQTGKSLIQRHEIKYDEISGEGVIVHIPGVLYQLDQKAAEKFGSSTWCITNPDSTSEHRESTFNHYSKQGTQPFFMITLSGKHSKIGLFPGSEGDQQFQDRINTRLDVAEIIELWNMHPPVYEAIKPFIANLHWILPKDIDAVDLAIFDTQQIYEYCRENRDNSSRWVNAEPYLMIQSYHAVWYAGNVIKGRWPEAEATILTDAGDACRYAVQVLQHRWPEAESIIATCASSSRHYAKTFIKERWELCEPAMLSTCFDALMYSKDVIKGRWPEAEPLILSNAHIAFYYASEVLKGRWPEAESIIKMDEYILSKYTAEVYDMSTNSHRLLATG